MCGISWRVSRKRLSDEKDRGDGSVYRRDLKLQVSMFSSRVSCGARDTK